MAAYNFQKKFAGKIRNGRKPCTIRARRKNGYLPKPGEIVSLYVGMRTKGCALLRRVKVKRVTPITIVTHDEPYLVQVYIDGQRLAIDQICELAQRDGFKTLGEFVEFFNYKHGSHANLYLIEW